MLSPCCISQALLRVLKPHKFTSLLGSICASRDKIKTTILIKIDPVSSMVEEASLIFIDFCCAYCLGNVSFIHLDHIKTTRALADHVKPIRHHYCSEAKNFIRDDLSIVRVLEMVRLKLMRLECADITSLYCLTNASHYRNMAPSST